MFRITALAFALALGTGAAAWAQDQGGQLMDEPTVRNMMGDMGYDVQGIDRTFMVQAQKDGKDVTLRVDAETGRVYDAEDDILVQEAAKRAAEDQGFSQVSELQREENSFVGKAQQNGENVEIKIDGKTGETKTMD